jgi:hypothetical protein
MGVTATVPILPEQRLTKSALMRPTPKAGAAGPLDRGSDETRSVPEPGQNIHLPLSKKKRAGLEIARCFERTICRYVFESVKSTG